MTHRPLLWPLALVLCASAPAAQFVNGDFETGDFTGWTLEYGAFSCGGVASWTTVLPAGHPASEIHTALSPLQPGQTLPVLPYAGASMARINNVAGGFHATRISQSTLLTAPDIADGGLSVKWGAMLVNPVGHTVDCQPAFEIEVLINGSLVESFAATGLDAGAPGSGWEPAGSTLWYRQEFYCTDISGYEVDDVVLVRLSVNDCGLGGHGAFAYLDDVGFGKCCEPPPHDMVGWWPLDEGPGSPVGAADLARGNTGTQVGPLVDDPQYVGGSLVFDGASTWIAVGDPADGALDVGPIPGTGPYPPNVGEFSADCWIRTTTFHSPPGTILEKIGCWFPGFLNCWPTGYAFYLDGDRLSLDLGQGTFSVGMFDSDPVPALLDGQWHLVAFTVDRLAPDGVKFYVDGAQVGVGQNGTFVTGSLANANSFQIGALGSSYVFDGNIDEVEFFKRALDPAEILAVYEAGQAGKCKEYCLVPETTSYCFSDSSKNVPVLIHNGAATPQTYSVSLEPLPGGTPGCDVPGPFPVSYTSVTVGAGDSFTYTIPVGKAAGLVTSGTKACFNVTVTNEATGHSFSCPSSQLLLPIGPCITVLTGTVAVAKVGKKLPVVFDVMGAGAQVALDYLVRPTASVGGEFVASSLSLDALPVGQGLSGTVQVPPQGTVQFAVDVLATEHLPFGAQGLELYADIDGDGNLELAASGLLQTEPGAGCVETPKGAVAWWALDELVGVNSADLVGEHDGTRLGDPLAVVGVVDGALEFDGVDDRVQVQHAPDLDLGSPAVGRGAFSIELWISTTQQGVSTLLDKRAKGVTPMQVPGGVGGGALGVTKATPGWALWLRDGVPEFQAQGFTTDAGVPIADGAWHHVVFTYRPRTDRAQWFVDGVLSAEQLGLPQSIAGAKANLLLGGGLGSETSFTGRLDEVTLYDRALGKLEVAELALSGKCK